jgi:hypothetical protein
MNAARLSGSLLLAGLGAIVALCPFAPSVPAESELRDVRGTLASSTFRSRVGSEIRIEGVPETFVYRSHGRLCGNVQDRLSAEIGKPVSLRYLPSLTTDWFGNPRGQQVFEINRHNGSLCSYAQVTAMIAGDFKVLPLVGYVTLFLGAGGLLSAFRGGGAEVKRRTKTWDELRADLQAEEHERLMGRQVTGSAESPSRRRRP